MWDRLISDVQTQVQQRPAAAFAKATVLMVGLIGAVIAAAGLVQRRSQHRTSVKPDVTAYIEKFLKPNVGQYDAVTIQNAGPGPAQKVSADLRARTRKRIGHKTQPEVSVTRQVASLAAKDQVRLEEAWAGQGYDGIRGVITFEDSERRRYWARRRDWAAEWERGEGPLPR